MGKWKTALIRVVVSVVDEQLGGKSWWNDSFGKAKIFAEKPVPMSGRGVLYQGNGHVLSLEKTFFCP